jgi:hypothetical protein
LGVVAQEAKAWDEAERCYRESLKLEEQMNSDSRYVVVRPDPSLCESLKSGERW